MTDAPDSTLSDHLFAELKRLDQAGDALMALGRIAEQALSSGDLLRVCHTLYLHRCDATAFLLADKLAERGQDHWIVPLVQAHIGGQAGFDDRAATARAVLKHRLAGLDDRAQAECRDTFNRRVSDGMIRARPTVDVDGILGVLEVAKAVLPVLEAAFPPEPAITGTVHERRSRLLAFPSPPPPEARRPRTVVVAMRDFCVPGDPRSRPFEIGPRLVRAMKSYGWTVYAQGIRSFSDPAIVSVDSAAIADRCACVQADLLIYDEFQLYQGAADVLTAFLAEVRRRRPGIIVASIYHDPWDRRFWDAITQAATALDRVWSVFPSLTDLWSRPAFVGKMLYQPVPSGPRRRWAPAVGGLRASFVGSVNWGNWPRNFWLAKLHQSGFEVQNTQSSCRADGLSAMASYGRYLSLLAVSGIGLNFSMRYDGTRPLTGRTFEVPWSGALLIQEANDDTDWYFTHEEHYLRFSTFPELATALTRVQERPDEAEAIRRRGHAFATRHYSEEQVIGSLDAMLW